jgi:hypothetical protein
VIRIAIFAAVLALLLAAQTPGWIAAIVAAIFGFAASYVFLGRLREQVAQDVYDRRSGKIRPDTDDEDAEDLLEGRGYLKDSDLEGDGQGKK